MKIGKVIGTVVSTHKLEVFRGVKFLIVQPLDENLKPDGDPLVASDSQQSGPGMVVTYVGGREATLLLPEKFNPTDATITSIIDSVDTD